MEMLFSFSKCPHCNRTSLHIFEEEKEVLEEGKSIIYYYETCLNCEHLGRKLDAIQYWKVTHDLWHDFAVSIHN